jgi:hypothetical protein
MVAQVNFEGCKPSRCLFISQYRFINVFLQRCGFIYVVQIRGRINACNGGDCLRRLWFYGRVKLNVILNAVHNCRPVSVEGSGEIPSKVGPGSG